jgi:hypothetical protein
MQWPIAFLRRTSEAKGAWWPRQDKQALSGAGDLIFNLADPCLWNDQQFRALLTDFGTISVTLAGAGLQDVLLGAAIGAGAVGVPATVVTDAVEGRASKSIPLAQLNETLFSLLEPFALLMPTAAFVSTMESGV